MNLTNTVNTFMISADDIDGFEKDKEYVLEFNWASNTKIKTSKNPDGRNLRANSFAVMAIGSGKTTYVDTGDHRFEGFIIGSSDTSVTIYLGKLDEERDFLFSQYFRMDSEIPQDVIDGGWGSVTIKKLEDTSANTTKITIPSDGSTVEQDLWASSCWDGGDSGFPIIFDDQNPNAKKKVSVEYVVTTGTNLNWMQIRNTSDDDTYNLKPYLYDGNQNSTDSTNGFMPLKKDQNISTTVFDYEQDKARKLESFHVYVTKSNAKELLNENKTTFHVHIKIETVN